MIKTLAIVIAALLLSGCDDPVKPESTTTVGNGVNLQTLFVKDGCTMYKFEDNRRKIYWANCPGEVHSRWSSTNGKGVTTQHDDQSMNTGMHYEVP